VDLQHGAVRGGRGHGLRGDRVPDPPGPGQQEEEARVPEAPEHRRWVMRSEKVTRSEVTRLEKVMRSEATRLEKVTRS